MTIDTKKGIISYILNGKDLNIFIQTQEFKNGSIIPAVAGEKGIVFHLFEFKQLDN